MWTPLQKAGGIPRPNSQARTGTEKKIIIPCLADHEQDWQPYPIDPYSAESAHHYIPSGGICVKTFSWKY